MGLEAYWLTLDFAPPMPAVLQGQVDEDPVAVLQAAHTAAAPPKVWPVLCLSVNHPTFLPAPLPAQRAASSVVCVWCAVTPFLVRCDIHP